MIKKLCHLTILTVLASTIMLSACGKLSAPSPVEGSEYPHTYPKR